MFCNNCGKEITEDAKFCIYCGNCLKSIEAKQENAKPRKNLEQLEAIVVHK